MWLPTPTTRRSWPSRPKAGSRPGVIPPRGGPAHPPERATWRSTPRFTRSLRCKGSARAHPRGGGWRAGATHCGAARCVTKPLTYSSVCVLSSGSWHPSPQSSATGTSGVCYNILCTCCVHAVTALDAPPHCLPCRLARHAPSCSPCRCRSRVSGLGSRVLHVACRFLMVCANADVPPLRPGLPDGHGVYRRLRNRLRVRCTDGRRRAVPLGHARGRGCGTAHRFGVHPGTRHAQRHAVSGNALCMAVVIPVCCYCAAIVLLLCCCSGVGLTVCLSFDR